MSIRHMNHVLGNKAQQAKIQVQKDDEGAELAGFGLPCQLQNNEQHLEHEGVHAKGQAKGCNLRFCKPPHQRASRSDRIEASTRAA